MSVDGWNSVLVLGGIRSGKSEFAESLVADAPKVRYVATAPQSGADDPDWSARIEAHRQRRPASWSTEEVGADPAGLIGVITAAGADETLLVDDLGGWVSVLLDPAHQPADDAATIDELALAVRDCTARLVLVSPEVGLSLVPTTTLGRAFTDALGTTNRAVADVTDAVVLVVAGQPTWLKPATTLRAVAVPAQPPGGSDLAPTGGGPSGTGTPGTTGSGPSGTTGSGTAGPGWTGPDGIPANAPVLDPATGIRPDGDAPQPAPAGAGTADPGAWTAPTMALPMVATGLIIQPGMVLPMPDEHAGTQAVERLGTLDVPGGGLGQLERVVSFAAATQGTSTPSRWRSVRVLLFNGEHTGGASAGSGAGEADRRADQARAGEGPVARLAAGVGAGLQVIDVPRCAPMEHSPTMTEAAVEAALRAGWRLAEEAADSGVQLIVLASCGSGTEAAAAAVLAANAGAEPAAMLGRVIAADGTVDDRAWMLRCAAVRDAMHRSRNSPRGPKDILAELAGGDISMATGVLLGATARRIPVLIDGPVGVAAAVISRDLAGQARHWCLLPDHGGHPAVRLAADVLGLNPLLDLRLNLGEGATSLAALPLLDAALALAGTLPVHPSHATTHASQPSAAEEWPGGPGGDDAETSEDRPGEFIEPGGTGPGPTRGVPYTPYAPDDGDGHNAQDDGDGNGREAPGPGDNWLPGNLRGGA